MSLQENSDSEPDFPGFPDDGEDEVSWLLKQRSRLKPKSKYVYVVHLPDGSESEDDDLDDGEDSELAMVYDSVQQPRASNFEVQDIGSESDDDFAEEEGCSTVEEEGCPRVEENGSSRMQKRGSSGAEEEVCSPTVEEYGSSRMKKKGCTGADEEGHWRSVENGSSRMQKRGSSGAEEEGCPRVEENGSSRMQKRGSSGAEEDGCPPTVEEYGSSRMKKKECSGMDEEGYSRSEENGSSRLKKKGFSEAEEAGCSRMAKNGSSRMQKKGSSGAEEEGCSRVGENGSLRVKKEGNSRAEEKESTRADAKPKSRKRKSGNVSGEIEKQPEKRSGSKTKRTRSGKGLLPSTDDLPKWEVYDQQSLIPQRCLSVFSPPPKQLTPYQYFAKLFTRDMITEIVKESNNYCEQKSDYNPHITPEEVEEFIGMLFLMSVVKMPSFRMYWGAETRYNPVADVMVRNRFEEIKRNMHFNDNTKMKKKGQEGYDKLFKIRPFLDALRTNLLDIEAEPEQSIDEIMVPSKARFEMRQFNPNKPHKFGWKITGRAGKSGILHDFEVYEGKGQNEPSTLGVSGDIVVKLVSTLEEGQHYRIYADNWFSSYKLAVELKRRGFEYTGTVRRNRVPNIILKPDSDMNVRGTVDTKESNDGIRLVKWKDNKIVHLISTYSGVQPADTVKRWSAKEKRFVEIDRPAVVREYNHCMGGIDLNDQLVALYRTDIGTKKFYFRLFMHMLDVCVVNSWLLYRRHQLQRGEEQQYTLLQFKLAIANTLIQYGQHVVLHRGRPSNAALAAKPPKNRTVVREPTPDVRYDESSHWPEVTDRQRCGLCKDRNKFTYFTCSKCKVPLCLIKERNCFRKYHAQP